MRDASIPPMGFPENTLVWTASKPPDGRSEWKRFYELDPFGKELIHSRTMEGDLEIDEVANWAAYNYDGEMIRFIGGYQHINCLVTPDTRMPTIILAKNRYRDSNTIVIKSAREVEVGDLFLYEYATGNEGKVNEIEREHYKGGIYNIQLKRNQCFFIREAGKDLWVGDYRKEEVKK